MRNRSLALLIVLALGTTTLAAAPLRDRRDRGPFDRVIQVFAKIFGISSTSDGLTPPRP